MTDAPTPAARDRHSPFELQPHQGSRVSRFRRAIFSFLITGACVGFIWELGSRSLPVPDGVRTTAIQVLGSIATFIGIGYIGGSVVDYSGLLSQLGAKFGVSIPFLKQPAAAPAPDAGQ